jgi:hypothetical protein
MADNLLLAAIENDDDLLLLSFSRKEESAISYQKLYVYVYDTDVSVLNLSNLTQSGKSHFSRF